MKTRLAHYHAGEKLWTVGWTHLALGKSVLLDTGGLTPDDVGVCGAFSVSIPESTDTRGS